MKFLNKNSYESFFKSCTHQLGRRVAIGILALSSFPSLGFIRYHAYDHNYQLRSYFPRPYSYIRYGNSWRWHTGHWYHGLYSGRAGWWWIVGPNWHYYERPSYPCPEVIAPTYVVEVNAGSDSPPPSTPTSNAQVYYCSSPAGYYPAVEDCPGGWAVTPAPPPH